ncbi:universal stress protein [Pontivivens nitratireducens]|jgi:nucleotide-binding universal stress UspA family protein|uniref:Universal stress protein n=1 Tax=Pontivivens nitratireducens TaxID=2758038 RepID=A0A6G7VH43_9RHOB|nr:universal stress protein [Pontibrevibacter nitratireducens]QIK39369.1 universal stress protein [Pontibrevibacter nitratireducens]
MRKFLVVLDESPECINAIRFAALRACSTTGGVQILSVIQPEVFQHWVGVGDLMRAEARQVIEEKFAFFAEKMRQNEGIDPELVIREGETAKEVLAQIKEDREIGVLVLAAGTHGDGPGPLVTQLAGRMAGDMPVPVTVVPGGMTLEQIRSVC